MADVLEMTTPQQYCARIADFLEEHPDAWTRFALGCTDRGDCVPPRDAQAKKFCALGLLMKFVPSDAEQSMCEQLLSRVITPYGFPIMRSVAYYNDRVATSVRDIIGMFRAASFLPDVALTSTEKTLTQGAYPMSKLKAELLEKIKMQPEPEPEPQPTFDWENLLNIPLVWPYTSATTEKELVRTTTTEGVANID